ncbi:MAG: hypothetical protein AB8B74_12315 [Crocinitomicaceae bacterium]
MKKLFTLGSLLFFLTASVFGQDDMNKANEKLDIGIFFNVPNSLPSLEFRMPISEQSKLRFAFDHNVDNNFPNQNGLIVTASDSLVVQKYRNVSAVRPTFRIGIDQQLKKLSWLTLGVDLQLRYALETVEDYYETVNKDSSGVWNSFPNLEALNDNGYGRRSVKYHYFMPALRVNVATQFPLGESFLLSFYYAGFLGPNLFLKETSRIDPNNDIAKPNDVVLNSESFIGLGVRYLWTKKDKN